MMCDVMSAINDGILHTTGRDSSGLWQVLYLLFWTSRTARRIMASMDIVNDTDTDFRTRRKRLEDLWSQYSELNIAADDALSQQFLLCCPPFSLAPFRDFLSFFSPSFFSILEIFLGDFPNFFDVFVWIFCFVFFFPIFFFGGGACW